jgi:ABC-type phosphate transport system permease subunit
MGTGLTFGETMLVVLVALNSFNTVLNVLKGRKK